MIQRQCKIKITYSFQACFIDHRKRSMTYHGLRFWENIYHIFFILIILPAAFYEALIAIITDMIVIRKENHSFTHKKSRLIYFVVSFCNSPLIQYLACNRFLIKIFVYSRKFLNEDRSNWKILFNQLDPKTISKLVITNKIFTDFTPTIISG